VLYKNRCERTQTALADTGIGTVRVCGAPADNSCECNAAGR
jgi:hypothetical protein